MKSACLTILCIFGSLSGRDVTYAQARQEPGRSIGTITTQGDLIVMTLNEGVFGKANLFDLTRRTLRFTPEGTGYRAAAGRGIGGPDAVRRARRRPGAGRGDRGPGRPAARTIPAAAGPDIRTDLLRRRGAGRGPDRSAVPARVTALPAVPPDPAV